MVVTSLYDGYSNFIFCESLLALDITFTEFVAENMLTQLGGVSTYIGNLHDFKLFGDFGWLLILLTTILLCSVVVLSRMLLKSWKFNQQDEKRVNYVSTHDRLTGLYNRQGLLDFLSLTKSIRPELEFAVICLDIVDFKYVNYAYSEEKGDELLVAVADSMKELFDDSGVVARVGVNEFVIVRYLDGEVPNVSQDINHIRQSMKEGFELSVSKKIPVQFYIGVSFFPIDSADVRLALQYSHVAMLRAKKNTSGDHEYYHSDMAKKTYRRIQLLRRLEISFAQKNSLKLLYQPIVTSDENVKYAEALLRWNDEVLGFVPPDEFISIVEETPLIRVLNQWVINESVRQIHRWAMDSKEVIVALNISRFDLFYKEIIQDLSLAVSKYNIKPSQLVVEIRESTVFSNEEPEMFQAIERLQSMGYRIAIDDFGTGFSNFSYLNQLPVDIVKIDKSLVSNIEEDQILCSICSAIFNLCSAMGKACVVEGVETQEQMNMTYDMGVRFFQGYHFSKPITARELVDFWEKSSAMNVANL